ncbi:MAG: hypothetical protein KKI08_07365 [Armatimonadetes bacterium]|nr:hypothetical protein [Armatimonadota bacterium]
MPARSGHVYVAQLLSEHPLYDQAQHLDQEIAALRRPLQPPAAPPLLLELGELFLPGPEPPRFPLEQFESQRHEWQLTLLPDRPAETTALAPDLAAELAWQRQTAEKEARTALLRLAAQADSRVAEARAAAVRARQEALNNAGLDLTNRTREAAAAAQRTRDQLWEEIEQETSRARAAAEAQLAEARRQVNDEMARRIAAATEDANSRMQKRMEIRLKSGSETKNRMSNTLMPPEPVRLEPGVAWQPGQPPEPFARESSTRSVAAADRQTREAQMARLAAARSHLQAQMYEAVALAVLRSAGIRGWDLRLPPDEPAEGPDLTERVRPDIRRVFRPEHTRWEE